MAAAQGLHCHSSCWAQVYAVLFDIGTGESSELLEHHVLLLVVNHICSDGLSEKICVDEIAAAYNAFASIGHPPASDALPNLPVSWVDYCFWQQGRTASGSALNPQARAAHTSICTQGHVDMSISSMPIWPSSVVPPSTSASLRGHCLICAMTGWLGLVAR